MLWSAKNNCFFLPTAGALVQAPDAIAVDNEVFNTFGGVAPAGKMRVVGGDDLPAWGDIPPPTHEELVITAETEKQNRIAQANDYMNSRQWPGKAAVGRLKGDELAQYNLWLDYLDALEAVKTTSAPDIKWPTPPASAEG
ncbi:tail fiber assembly protein [Yokenella regensburgei]|uniref:Caudovirales tail fibre assembly protein n=1 Tax=Yokenella regensburgei TaxID=158877 RepID=A0AB38FUD4_9ENTR|nr:tail assembly chaperone [Yokenella regensburgei]KFD25575.1 tail fiber assembly protein [Yokenella regensburgei ATCC 49455]SQA62893.1 Caudovirales tail fibre assembly protein [Yokenella regensburgei]SQA63632.1 Caudovirales tail fibre assembly protein [Yokenella regensburgei]SQA95402.1 Caudovirales tail fibre assembly protein [Yokenella regensburgei]SQB02452.1 Caudovirales tail fibre assembly protein [Yokenella regensburgei]